MTSNLIKAAFAAILLTITMQDSNAASGDQPALDRPIGAPKPSLSLATVAPADSDQISKTVAAVPQQAFEARAEVDAAEKAQAKAQAEMEAALQRYTTEGLQQLVAKGAMIRRAEEARARAQAEAKAAKQAYETAPTQQRAACVEAAEKALTRAQAEFAAVEELATKISPHANTRATAIFTIQDEALEQAVTRTEAAKQALAVATQQNSTVEATTKPTELNQWATTEKAIAKARAEVDAAKKLALEANAKHEAIFMAATEEAALREKVAEQTLATIDAAAKECVQARVLVFAKMAAEIAIIKTATAKLDAAPTLKPAFLPSAQTPLSDVTIAAPQSTPAALLHTLQASGFDQANKTIVAEDAPLAAINEAMQQLRLTPLTVNAPSSNATATATATAPQSAAADPHT